MLLKLDRYQILSVGFGCVVILSTYSVFASCLDSKDVVVQNIKELILPEVCQILLFRSASRA